MKLSDIKRVLVSSPDLATAEAKLKRQLTRDRRGLARRAKIQQQMEVKRFVGQAVARSFDIMAKAKRKK